MFNPVDPKPNFPKLEEKILRFWKENKIFEKSVEQRPEDNRYSFYDGPPFITGLPHYGSLLSSVAKDVVLRYQAMRGKKIRRVWGWDCHGLPAEVEVEKILGTKSRRDIEKLGIKKFNEECRRYVSKTSAEWEWYVDHVGRWVDFKNAYKTMDLDYMETVIWVFKQLYEKGLIYKGKRVSLFCPRCSTPLSKFEITMDVGSYKDVKDPAVTIKFKLKNEENVFILAWTTTPWTLPSNFALAVDKDETYVKAQKDGEVYILAEKRFKSVCGEDSRVQESFKGEKLLGLEYEPLYTFFETNDKDYKIYDADFVSMEEGTGIVHIAPGFGEGDTELGAAVGLSMADSVDDEGKFTEKLGSWTGLYFKEANERVVQDLSERGLLLRREEIVHSYPFCYRCEAPLIYKAQEAWYVNIDQLREGLLKTNEHINWVPDHFKHGRFEYNLKAAPHWCISRTRYWGTPLPVWECSCGERYVLGSIKEIEEFSGQKVTDLHRPAIDEITIKCQKCGGEARRVPEVLDCWMESGLMPYGEWHYPFESEEQFKRGFPADFIVEYTGQLRAWFYYLHVLSNALFGSECFKNVVVTGVTLGSDGKKMSKSLGNYPDPKLVLQKYGGDALRCYLMDNPLMNGEDVSVLEQGIAEQVKSFLLLLWNSYKFFVTFANLHNWNPSWEPAQSDHADHVLDRWILSRINQVHQNCTREMGAYHVPLTVQELKGFVNDLSKWYIRRSRYRFRGGDELALRTLYQVFIKFAKIAAPIIPFLAEEIYQSLTLSRVRPSGGSDPVQSVHLEDWPEVELRGIDKDLEEQMNLVRQVVEKGHAARKEAGIKVRQPLVKIVVRNVAAPLCGARPPKADPGEAAQSAAATQLIQLIKDELNVKEVEFVEGRGDLEVELDTKLTPELKAEGEARELVRQIQDLRKEAGCSLDDRIIVEAPSWPKEFEDDIKQKTLATNLRVGPKLKVIK